jgi:RNA-directed DNA polymerase
MWERQYAHLGELVRYADDLVVVSRSKEDCEEAELRIRQILAWLRLELHPEKTRRVELTRGREGFDFLGCHLRRRMSGPIWEKKRRKVYFLHRWPSARSMTRVRQRVKELTGSNRSGVKDVRVIIRDINPVLRGWGTTSAPGTPP